MEIQPGGAIGGTAAKEKPKNTITPEFRVSFPYLFRPNKPMQAGSEPKFSVVMLFPPNADLSALQKMVYDCIVEEFGPDRTKWPKMRNPFRDQGEKTMEGYVKGAIFITATSKNKPGLVDANVQPIIEESQFYAGCYARASVRAFYYDQAGNKGIGIGLQNVQKLRDGEPLAGRLKPEDDFTPVEVANGGAAPLSAKDIFG